MARGDEQIVDFSQRITKKAEVQYLQKEITLKIFSFVVVIHIYK